MSVNNAVLGEASRDMLELASQALSTSKDVVFNLRSDISIEISNFGASVQPHASDQTNTVG